MNDVPAQASTSGLVVSYPIIEKNYLICVVSSVGRATPFWEISLVV